jgi:signal transduction histidine kinase
LSKVAKNINKSVIMNHRPRSTSRSRPASVNGKSPIALRNAQFQAINAVAVAISEQSSLVPLLNRALDAVLEATGLSGGLAHLLDEENESLKLISHRGLEPAEADRHLAIGEGMIGRAAASGEMLIATNAASDGRISVPMIARGRVRGVLSFYQTGQTGQTEPRLFTDHEKEMLSIIGRQLGVALEQARLLEEIDKSHREWEQTFDTLADGIAIHSPSGRIRLANRLIHQERISAIGELAAGIAHEIGTPLNIISANIEYLIRHHSRLNEESSPAGAGGELIAIRDQVHNITRLIRQLLNFARDQSPAFVPLDINDLIERTLELLGYRLTQAQIVCQTSLDRNAPSINGDAVPLQQVLFNLIANARQAIEASEQQSGLLSISTATSPIATDECSRPHVVITIADDGPGIPMEILPHVFNPFFTANKEGGTGLGLAICRQIIQRHFGSMTIDNASPHGAIVKIYLPLLIEQN